MAKEVVTLFEDGNMVITGSEDDEGILRGAPVEVELRIAKNETNFPIRGVKEGLQKSFSAR